MLPVIALLAILTGCNMPGRQADKTPTPSGFEMINTSAARTVAAQLTEISQPPVATGQPLQKTQSPTPSLEPGSQATPLPTQRPAVTIVPQPTKAPQAGACDRAKFVKDVTIPDNTVLQPGESFTKTWRLLNVGDCTWDEAYKLVFVKGDRLGDIDSVSLKSKVGPDDTLEISVPMTAPDEDGEYRSDWKLMNNAGQVFGTGKNGDLTIWAQIIVGAGSPDNTGSATQGRQVDFISSASSADWYSAAGDNAGEALAFNGAPDDPAGAAILADELRLETGQTSGKILLMVPQSQQDGYVYGIFPAYQVQAGDRFLARVGFAANPDGRCGEGRVIFQLAVMEGEDIDTLQEVPAACDGALTPIDLDLSKLRGRNVKFILVVRADGSPQDDWAVWNSPQITNKE
jgi:hypothetical protein